MIVHGLGGLLCCIMLMAICGCAAKTWVHATKNDAAYEHDITFCRGEASAAAMRSPEYQGMVFNMRVKRCMTSRGWTWEAERIDTK